MEKLLSIIIPTFNRAQILKSTLLMFKEQVLRNNSQVELIVCDNASTDDTDSIMSQFVIDEPFFSYKHYTEHLAFGGDSFVRSIENAAGHFCMVYGDDDIPMPYLVDYLLDCIRKYPDVGYICFNRLRGNSSEDSFGIENIQVAGTDVISEGVEEYADVCDFAELHQNEVGFISVNIIRTDLWNMRYKDVYPNDCRGYEFILPYLYSGKGHRCIYIQSPLCVQRLPSRIKKNVAQTWGDKLLLYFYLGRPRAIFAQEQYGIVKDAKRLFQAYEKQFGINFLFQHLINMTNISTEVIECVDEMTSYLSDKREIKMIERLLSTNSLKRKLYRLAYGVQFIRIGQFFNKVKRLLK